MAVLELQNVSYENDNKKILSDVSLLLEAGDFLSIVGPSGSGKSTLLRLCSNLISPTSGDILFKGKSVSEYNPTEWRRHIAYCFQTPQLFGNTVKDNISFPYTIRNSKTDEIRVEELFRLFQMSTEYLEKDVRTLSGGEKQRIALIRSLLFLPEILLLDEVTSSLDEENTIIVEEVIKTLNKKGIIILWITHNSAQSKKYANKLLQIEAGRVKSLEEL